MLKGKCLLLIRFGFIANFVFIESKKLIKLIYKLIKNNYQSSEISNLNFKQNFGNKVELFLFCEKAKLTNTLELKILII